jgi:hypothetical protein
MPDYPTPLILNPAHLTHFACFIQRVHGGLLSRLS